MSNDGIKIPRRLPLLLTHEAVLLPGSTARLSVNTPRNMQLVRSRLLTGTSLRSTIIGVGAHGRWCPLLVLFLTDGLQRVVVRSVCCCVGLETFAQLPPDYSIRPAVEGSLLHWVWSSTVCFIGVAILITVAFQHRHAGCRSHLLLLFG
ncbi:hypothetical protein CRUP_007607 [Coryphaenoides rupestris]|nr:hypothetical protein CRUP_007607 [Coryphaenoides rupestris]